jgi:hypothetical protein
LLCENDATDRPAALNLETNYFYNQKDTGFEVKRAGFSEPRAAEKNPSALLI